MNTRILDKKMDRNQIKKHRRNTQTKPPTPQEHQKPPSQNSPAETPTRENQTN